MQIPTYRVTLNTPKGVGVMDVPSFLGADAASRRAIFTAASAGWGDLPDIKLVSSLLVTEA